MNVSFAASRGKARTQWDMAEGRTIKPVAVQHDRFIPRPTKETSQGTRGMNFARNVFTRFSKDGNLLVRLTSSLLAMLPVKAAKGCKSEENFIPTSFSRLHLNNLGIN